MDNTKQPKEEDIVMCTVKRIEGATVFVEIEGDGEGSIALSEIAACRIRNIRDYVSPNKKIVCKILKILSGNIQLSLRRVTGKEREEIEERYKREKTFSTILKTIIPNHEPILDSIKKEYELWDFVEKIKENPSLLEKFVNKEQASQLVKILSEKKEKEKIVKKIIIIKSLPAQESSIKDIKDSLKSQDVNIRYLGSSQFSISAIGKNFKEADHKVSAAVQEIAKQAKLRILYFELKEK